MTAAAATAVSSSLQGPGLGCFIAAVLVWCYLLVVTTCFESRGPVGTDLA